MGVDPTTSPVTGERSTVELQPQIFSFLSRFNLDCVGGRECACDPGLMSPVLY